MIPSLKTGEATTSQYTEYLAELRIRGFDGEVSTNYADRTVLATPNLKEAVISVIDMQTLKEVKRIPTPGPGFSFAVASTHAMHGSIQ